jgi:cytochrome c oxidase subunit III
MAVLAGKLTPRDGTVGPSISFPPWTGRGGAGTPPPVDRGGDDGHGDSSPNYPQRLRRARMALLLAIAPIAMFFVVIVVAAVARHYSVTLDQETNLPVRSWMPVELPVALLMINTALLLASSLTAELARRQITRQAALAPIRSIPGVSLGKESRIPWLAFTVVLGIAFLTGQWMAWHELAHRGFYLATSASSSFVYLLTTAHAVHLLGGILVLLYAASLWYLRRPVDARRIVVDVTALYWHFMFVLWVGIFAFLWLNA